MNRSLPVLLAAAIGLFIVSPPVKAHHSFAQFDTEHVVDVTGTVTKFEWSNPHAYVFLDVKGDKGNVENWVAELTGLAMLTRSGWTRNSVKPGDQVTIHGHRARDGRTFLVIRSIVLANGQELKNGALPPGTFN